MQQQFAYVQELYAINKAVTKLGNIWLVIAL